MLNETKAILKAHGVKGFRKLKLKRVVYTIGKQTQFMDSDTAFSLMGALTAMGWKIEQADVCAQLAAKGLLDTLSVTPKF